MVVAITIRVDNVVGVEFGICFCITILALLSSIPVIDNEVYNGSGENDNDRTGYNGSCEWRR